MEKMAKIQWTTLRCVLICLVSVLKEGNVTQFVNEAMPVIDKAVEQYNLDTHYDRALDLVSSGRAREAFDLGQERFSS